MIPNTLKELIIDNSEVVLDYMLDDGLLKEIPIISIDKLAVAKSDIFSVILRLTRNIIIKNNISKILFFLITNEPVIKYYIFHSLFFQHQTSKNVLLLYLDRQRPYYNH